MLLGSLVVSFITKKIGERGSLRTGLFLVACGYGFMYFAKSLPGVMVCVGILGFGIPIGSAGLHTIIQRNTPADKMGRVSSVMSTLGLAAMPLSTATAGFLGEVMPLPTLFALLGSLVAFLTVLFTFNRTFRSHAVLGTADRIATDA